MIGMEKKESIRVGIRTQLERRVRAHRPANKVLEIDIVIREDRLERMKEQIVEMEWAVEYVQSLKPEDIEPDEKNKS